MSSFSNISVDQARVLLAAGSAQLVDIRDEHAFAEAHIDGAHRLDNANIGDFIAAADKNRPLLVVCYHGISSQHAAQFFAAEGFAEVYSLSGGFEEWRRANPPA